MTLNKEEDWRILPGLLASRSARNPLGDSPATATANACVAAAELVRRRDDRDDVTTTPGKTFFNELSAALRMLCRGDARTSLKRFANEEKKFDHPRLKEKSRLRSLTKPLNILRCRLIRMRIQEDSLFSYW